MFYSPRSTLNILYSDSLETIRELSETLFFLLVKKRSIECRVKVNRAINDRRELDEDHLMLMAIMN